MGTTTPTKLPVLAVAREYEVTLHPSGLVEVFDRAAYERFLHRRGWAAMSSDIFSSPSENPEHNLFVTFSYLTTAQAQRIQQLVQPIMSASRTLDLTSEADAEISHILLAAVLRSEEGPTAFARSTRARAAAIEWHALSRYVDHLPWGVRFLVRHVCRRFILRRSERLGIRPELALGVLP